MTIIEWYDPAHPEQPVFRYVSYKNTEAHDLMLDVTYHPTGERQSIHVELGSASGDAEAVVEAYSVIVSSAVSAAIEAAKIANGIP